MFKSLRHPFRPPPAPPPREVTDEALRAVPRHSPAVEVKPDLETGKLYLRLPLSPRNPLGRLIGRSFGKQKGWKPGRQFDLDPVGREFWELCNGRRTLAQIEKRLRSTHGWSPRECREAVIQYTRILTEKQLLFLDLSHRDAP